MSTNNNDLQNNELKIPVSSIADTTTTSESIECSLESSSVPDADLTECLATATEALTEILVKTNVVVVDLQDNQNDNDLVDTNGNKTPTLPSRQNPNVSSSSTQTECPPPLGSCHSCCCTDWNHWKQRQLATNDKSLESYCGSSSSSNSSTAVTDIQCQPVADNLCFRHHLHRRKKASNTTKSCYSEPVKDKVIGSCECDTVSSIKYSKSWRELRKASKSNCKRSSSTVCRFHNCHKRNSSKSM